MNLKRIIKKLSGKGKPAPTASPYFRDDVFTNQKQQYKKYDIGEYTYGFPKIFDFDDYDDIATKPTKLSIGKFCSIGSDVKIILGSEHRTDWVTTYPFNAIFNKHRHIQGHPDTKGDIVIGNDVWIATNVTILSGVTIGNGAVIGANSLVTKNVPAYGIVAGVPAKHIKYRFSADVIEQLEQIKWWDLPIAEIEEHVALLQSDNIQGFIDKMRQAT